MDSHLPDPLYFSLPGAITAGLEIMDLLTIHLTESDERKARWSLFLGITIWFLHLNVLNALVSVSCKWGWLTYPIGGLSGLQLAETIISVIVMLAMLVLIYLPWRIWQEFQTEKPTENPELLQETEEDSRPLLAFIAMLLNGFLLLFVIAAFVPVFALRTCGQA